MFTHLPHQTFASLFAPKGVIWCHNVTSHDVILWHHMSSHHRPCHSDGTRHLSIVLNYYVMKFYVVILTFDLWPTTLTYTPSLAKVNYHTKNQGHRLNGLAVRVLTHRHTQGSNSMTSIADASCQFFFTLILTFNLDTWPDLKGQQTYQKWRLNGSKRSTHKPMDTEMDATKHMTLSPSFAGKLAVYQRSTIPLCAITEIFITIIFSSMYNIGCQAA